MAVLRLGLYRGAQRNDIIGHWDESSGHKSGIIAVLRLLYHISQFMHGFSCIYPHKNLKNPTDAYILIFSRTIPEQADGFFRRPDRRE